MRNIFGDRDQQLYHNVNIRLTRAQLLGLLTTMQRLQVMTVSRVSLSDVVRMAIDHWLQENQNQPEQLEQLEQLELTLG